MSENAQQQSFRFPYARTPGIPRDEVAGLRQQYRTLLRDLRTKLNCTQDELADSIGASRSYINLLENQASSCNLRHAEAVVKKAYEQYNVPLHNLPTIPGPAEVEPEVLAAAPVPTRAPGHGRIAVAKALEDFRTEFGLTVGELYDVLGVNKGAGYLLRHSRKGTSVKVRKQVMALLEAETVKRRTSPRPAEPAPVPVAPPPPAPVVATPVVAAPQPVPVAPAVAVIPATLVPNLAAIASVLEFDFRTKHRFQKLPDGTILVTKEM